MELVDGNIVVLGHFNPHIIEPKWLADNGVIDPEESGAPRNLTLVQGGPQRFTFVCGNFTWEVGSERLLVGSEAAASPKEVLLKLFESLPHTPVRALGINFKAKIDLAGVETALPLASHDEWAQKTFGSRSSMSHISKYDSSDGTQTTLTVTSREGGIDLEANFHRALRRDAIKSGMLSSAINEFEGDKDRFVHIATLYPEAKANA